ncbi:RNI-like protein [Saccharata proteae CBS 121410]|uniref:RNI-like protein n=1 Tax=Saccharata proteae CBS 121410 TaxID=1314787 RepID=A0A9P4I081_9PEZI|nr:RNI-like protein [Saccharata proteae CBS 121410]
MRRHHRGSGQAIYASKANGAPVPDPFALIRAFDSETNPTKPVRPSPLTASTIHGLPLDLLDRLRSFPLFMSAPDTFLAAIGTHLRPHVYSPHDYIMTEGDDAKAMYWIVRGAVRVTSRDGESTFAELKPGAFFGEIGVLMDVPRTATIVAKMRSMVVRLNKEDLRKELPNFPDVERAIREEAKERLAILERKKKEIGSKSSKDREAKARAGKRPRDNVDGDVEMGDAGVIRDGEIVSTNKKRKSPSPSLAEAAAASALGSGAVNVRQLLRELPLFASLPDDILHFLGLNAQPQSYPPFTEIVQQGTQGRDVFFIVRGEVEVVIEKTPDEETKARMSSPKNIQHVVARLKPGQYFGEVVSLSLAPRRTATVRSISSAECLVIGGDVLQQFWLKCSPELRAQVEVTAKSRMESSADNDSPMLDAHDGTPPIDELEIADWTPRTPSRRRGSLPSVTFTESVDAALAPYRKEDNSVIEPFDPDPFLNVDLDNLRSRSRRSSLAPPPPGAELTPEPAQETPKSPSPSSQIPVRPSLSFKHEAAPPERSNSFKRPKIIRRPSRRGKGILPDKILVQIFQNLDILELMQIRRVSMHWLKLVSTNPHVLQTMDLTPYNRRVTDSVLANIICPFAGNRPRVIDISNCFHVTDEGFTVLATQCGANVKQWKMKSVWDITGQAVLEMVNRAKGLEEVDLSNCRKVGDNLLARVIGWVVPELPPQAFQPQQVQVNGRQQQALQRQQQQQQQHPPPGTVVGCPKLRRLTLSYCKHITDRSMAHIAVHAASRLEQIDLTRCTTITDQGFHHWSIYPFTRLTKICLADCTYLTDNAIVYLTNAAKALKELDLSFCCALSDTATEVLALGCSQLTHLNLAFCGSAVSDSSLRSISLHLLELRALSVRGCVRVTGTGVEAVLDGCASLETFDVSQCKNLRRWLDGGGIARRGRGVKFITVAEGPMR